ncbi:MAG: alpha/beta hydrolase, partial [Thermoplasmatales archaeon]
RSIVNNNADPKWKLKEDELRSIGSETLVMWGELDTVIPKSNGLLLKELIPRSRYVEIKEAGHVPHVVKASEVGQVINDFLKS